MPVPLEYMDLTDTAVYWGVASHNREGFPQLEDPVALSVRWEEDKKEIIDSNGERIQTDVTIATTQLLDMNSIMWEGSLADLADIVGTSYIPQSDLYEVVVRWRAKDLLGKVTRYEYGLRRYSDSLPEVV